MPDRAVQVYKNRTKASRLLCKDYHGAVKQADPAKANEAEPKQTKSAEKSSNIGL